MPSPWVPAGSGGGLVDSVSGAAPVTSTGGINPIVGITAATDLAAGSLSAADKTKLDGITSCVSNLTLTPGQYACAENDQSIASGFASHAEGHLSRAGSNLLAFTVAPGGVTLTIATPGDFTSKFERGVVGVRIITTAPVAGTTWITRTVVTTPTQVAGHTVFDISAPIDGTTTNGSAAQSDNTLPVLVVGSIPAGGTLVTLAGNQTANFLLNQQISITPLSPVYLFPITRLVASLPVFAAGNTTFNLDSAIDATTVSADFGNSQGKGYASHAEGINTIARGPGSHSEGRNTTADGPACHTEGIGTFAFGDGSHAEGWFDPNFFQGGPIAYNSGAHAEGELTVAGGPDSHAEGIQNIAAGFCAHAEGALTHAGGDYSHVEGTLNIAGNPARTFTCAAGGTAITIVGVDATLEFPNGIRVTALPKTPAPSIAGTTLVSSIPVFAAGNTTFNIATPIDTTTTGGLMVAVSVGKASHAEGQGSIANGQAAHAEGYNGNIASGRGAHAEGENGCTASAEGAHAEGNGSIASGAWNHAEGFQTTANGVNGAHSEGRSSTASGNDGAHAEGFTTIASGQYSHAEGDRTTAAGLASHSEGSQGGVSAAGQYGHSEGFLTSTTGVNGAHSEGRSTLASGNDGSHAEGLLTTASGQSSHAEGHSTTASGQYSHAQGDTTTASGVWAHAGGVSCVASGNASFAHGSTCSSLGVNSRATGANSKALRDNYSASASGQFAAQGDAQSQQFEIRGATPGVAPGEAVLLGPSGTTQNILEVSKAYNVTVRVIATLMGVGAAARQTGAFFINFIASRRSGGVIDISAVTAVVPLTVQGAAFVGSTLVPTDGGAGSLALTFTNGGALTNNARIVGRVEQIEVLGT